MHAGWDTFSAFSTRLGLPLLLGLDSMDLHQKIHTNVEVAVPAALATRLRRSVNRSTLQRALGLAELAVPKLEGGTNRRHRKGADSPPPSRCGRAVDLPADCARGRFRLAQRRQDLQSDFRRCDLPRDPVVEAEATRVGDGGDGPGVP